jgi:single stranded DNA-binding protein
MNAHISASGRLGGDPVRRVTASGKQLTSGSLAVSQADGEPTLWLRLSAFGRLADQLDACHKGEAIAVFGRLQLRKWKDNNGQERESLQCTVDQLHSVNTAIPDPAPATEPRRTKRNKPDRSGSKQPEPQAEAGLPFDDGLPF